MLKILIVEDNATSRQMIARLIHSLGYTPILAGDGARGLAVLEDNPDIACVVTDCQMPNLSGPEMVKEIRQRLKSGVPVLIYSSYLGVKEVGGLLDQGATGFLNYPVTRENLGEYIGRHVAHA